MRDDVFENTRSTKKADESDDGVDITIISEKAAVQM